MMNINKRIVLVTVGALLCTLLVGAQMATPVQWRKSIAMLDATHGAITLSATIDDGWHLYATELPSGGPLPTTVEWTTLDGVTLDGELKASTRAHTQHDDTFDMDLSWYTGSVSFRQAFTATAPRFTIAGKVRYMACNDVTCTAPASEEFSLTGKAQPAAQDDTPTTSAVVPVAGDSALDIASAATPDSLPATWAPVKATAYSADSNGNNAGSLWQIFGLCLLGGLLALLTPCVWPIIPMTVSFFLKRTSNRRRAIMDAVTYGIAIIVIYVVLGLTVTALFGASTLNAIATNAVCNMVFFALLVIFAVSFFGAFELQLPQSWGRRMDGAAERTTGLLSIFFMAFTLVIVSFSCTGPIIGTLLVQAATSGSRLSPAIGMFGFALALAVPFALFALFPAALHRLPRSGGWLNTVKVVLGFLELALALKFLSVADLAYGWHILDREVFLSLWIAIFGLLGLYLLGVIRLRSDGESDGHGIGVMRLMSAMVALAFTAYLIPGLWGAPLRVTSAFLPPLSTQDFNLYGETLLPIDDYDVALAQAHQKGKPLLIDFSGYGCVNCRKMEGAVLDRPQVAQYIADHFVMARLMVDDKTALPQPRTINEAGRTATLTTYGDLWSYLQRHKFGANSQPYYVVVDADGSLLSGPVAYDEDINRFMRFLNHAQQ